MRRKLKTVEELEQAARIERTEERRPTLNDRDQRERKMLGPSWGKPRRKFFEPK